MKAGLRKRRVGEGWDKIESEREREGGARRERGRGKERGGRH